MIERRTPLWRRLLSWIFLILFCLAAPAALVAGWARQTLIDEETYTRTVAHAADDPRVPIAVSRVVVNRTENLLSGDNPNATEALQSRVVAEALGEVTRGVVDSEEFRQTWEASNRDAHRLLFSEPAVGQGQPVSLDFSPLLDDIQAEVAALDVDVPPELNLDAEALRIDVLNPETANWVRQAMARLDVAFWVALALTVLALLLSVGLAPDRLAAIGRAGFGLGIAMITLIALMLVAQAWLAGAAGDGGGVAVGAILDAVSQGLRVSAVALALGGLLVAGIFAGLRALRGSMTRRVVTEG